MACRVFPRIARLRAYTVDPTKEGQEADARGEDGAHWINGDPNPLASPMSGYPQYATAWSSWGINSLGTVVAEVEADDGTQGVGVSIGGEPACHLIEKHLSMFVEGQDPRNVELIWDQMYRSTLHYGRKGLPIQAISAVDLAVWDLLGKLRNEPVYALLGGKTKNRLPVYSTTPRPDIAKKQDFIGAKISCPYGPSAGEQGFRKNVEFFKSWRQKVGPEFPLMLDCYMSMSAQYAIRLARELQPLGLKWIEECLHPDDYRGYSDLKTALSSTGVMVTTGEHEYTRYGFRQLIDSRCADILQPDITWMGGITEARRVVAMASAEDVMVIPHGSSVYSYHLQYAFGNCPIAEYINTSPRGDRIVPCFGGLFADEPLPKNGFIDLPDKPGFGVTLSRDHLRRPFMRTDEHSAKQAAKNHQMCVSETAIMPF